MITRTLLANLDSYQDYARCVRYRLVPGVWTESASYLLLTAGVYSTGVTTTEGAERSAGPW